MTRRLLGLTELLDSHRLADSLAYEENHVVPSFMTRKEHAMLSAQDTKADQVSRRAERKLIGNLLDDNLSWKMLGEIIADLKRGEAPKDR